MDGEKFSPRFPQSEPGFAQPVPKLITRVGDNAFTRMGEAAATCGVMHRSYPQASTGCGKPVCSGLAMSVMSFS